MNNDRIGMLKAHGALAGKGWLVIDDTLTHKTVSPEMTAGTFSVPFLPVFRYRLTARLFNLCQRMWMALTKTDIA